MHSTYFDHLIEGSILSKQKDTIMDLILERCVY